MPRLQILKEQLTDEMSAGTVCLLLTALPEICASLRKCFLSSRSLGGPSSSWFSFVAEGHQFSDGPTLACNQKTSLSHTLLDCK